MNACKPRCLNGVKRIAAENMQKIENAQETNHPSPMGIEKSVVIMEMKRMM